MRKLWTTMTLLGLLGTSLFVPCGAWSSQPESEFAVEKILGGRATDIRNWPWIVALLHAGVDDPFQAQFCGGTLLSGEWVVTAAHCVTDRSGALAYAPADLHLLIGRTDLRGDGGDRIPVAQIVVHPQYNPNTNESDLALLQLARQPVAGTMWGALPLIPPGDPAGLTSPGVPAWVAGWGSLGSGRGFPNVLQEAELPIVSQVALILAYPPPFFIVSDNMIGAGPGDGTRDTCQGDSGGPMIVRDGQGNAFLAGVTSWGLQCGTPGIYGVYVRMANYCGWVKGISGVGDCGGEGGGGGCTVASSRHFGGDWLILMFFLVAWVVWRRLGRTQSCSSETVVDLR
ncbi:S1 family peptidase [Desulfonatronum thioautotrophicum]|uniref:S1 family peptidase n=1 Tax=Desulfonatronum thioautotrophicum TaxID=617001 RepID=UPI000699D503|nr:serine protease [Desulfonatronum thioautotrophicum]